MDRLIFQNRISFNGLNFFHCWIFLTYNFWKFQIFWRLVYLMEFHLPTLLVSLYLLLSPPDQTAISLWSWASWNQSCLVIHCPLVSWLGTDYPADQSCVFLETLWFRQNPSLKPDERIQSTCRSHSFIHYAVSKLSNTQNFNLLDTIWFGYYTPSP